jgi:two-component system NtrC family response regulator
MKKILIIDDDTAVCISITLLLKRRGFDCFAVNRPAEVLEKIASNLPDLILLDMNFTIDTSGKQGLKLLRLLQENYGLIPVILMTGWATVQLAVEGMKLGAKDFIAKPWDNQQLVNSIKTILDLNDNSLPHGNRPIGSFDHIIGNDERFLEILQMAKRVSKTNASVLITGESGTGKELIAEAIHYESKRMNEAFMKVNLGGISTSLFESELFGHKKGAFTDAVSDRKGRFEMANNGTIFLDEIGDLALNSQVKLLRVLQEQTFEALGSSQTQRIDVRVISATNKDLEEMIALGTFREDLFYRINLIKIHLPPLRERKNDIPLLVDFYVNNLKMTYEQPNLSVHKSAMNWLKEQEFSGNIRELKNLVERTVLMANSDELAAADFQRNYRKKINENEKTNFPKVGSMTLEEMEIKMIKRALDFHENNISTTAKALGITRNALYRRMEKYNV